MTVTTAPGRFREFFLLHVGLLPFLLAFPVYRLIIQLNKQVALPRWLGVLDILALVFLLAGAVSAVVAACIAARLGERRLVRGLVFGGVVANFVLLGLGVYFNEPALAPRAWAGTAALLGLVVVAMYARKDPREQSLTLRTLAMVGVVGLAMLGLTAPYVATAAWADHVRALENRTAIAAVQPKAGAPRRIVLVTFDGLRYGSTSLGNPALDTTPALAALAKDATWFSNCHSAGDQTIISMPTVLSGRRPTEVFSRVHNLMSYMRQGSLTGVAARLKAAGYHTAYSTMLITPQTLGMRDEYDDGYSAAVFADNPFNGRDFIPLGEVLTFMMPSRFKRHRASGLPFDLHPAYSVVEQGLAQYRSTPGPSFLWVHLGLPHPPVYLIPREDLHKPIKPPHYRRVHFFRNGHQDDPSFYRQAYEGYVRFSDVIFQQLIDGLRASPDWRDTLLIVTSDHGLTTDPSKHEPYACGDASEDITHVPLLIHAPGQVRPARVEAAVRHEDLVPTILAQVYPAVPAGFPGAPLTASRLPDERIGYTWAVPPRDHFDPALPQTYAAYRGRLKYTLQYPGATERLTDWVADAKGERDRSAEHPEAVAALRAWVDRELVMR